MRAELADRAVRGWPPAHSMNGKAMGVEHAVLFRAHDLQAPPEFFTEATQD